VPAPPHMGFLKNSKPALKPTHVLVPLSSHGLDLETAEVMARKDGLSQGTCAKCLRLCVYKIQHEALTGLQTTAREALVVAAELGIVEIKNPQSGPGDLPGRCMLNWDLLHKKMPNFLEWALPKVPVAADTAVVVGVLQQGIERVEESIADVAKRQSVVLLRMEEGFEQSKKGLAEQFEQSKKGLAEQFEQSKKGLAEQFEQSKKGLAEQFEQSVNRATMLLLKSAQKQHEKIVEALTPGATTEDHTVAALRRAFTLQNEVEVAQAQERDLGAVMVSPRRLSYKAQVRFSPCSQGSLALSSSESLSRVGETHSGKREDRALETRASIRGPQDGPRSRGEPSRRGPSTWVPRDGFLKTGAIETGTLELGPSKRGPRGGCPRDALLEMKALETGSLELGPSRRSARDGGPRYGGRLDEGQTLEM